MHFEERVLVDDDPARPTLTMFEHVDGSRVCEGMFPSYQLPNGKQAFMYYKVRACERPLPVWALV